MSKKALLMILDGWGIGDQGKDDVIFNTPTPYWDSLLANYPHSELQASGENVGLPDGQMGNSEVGHLNIGAGRIVYQDLVKINRACADNSIMKNPEIVSAFSYAKENGKNIHFMGLTSNGGVHSSFDHLFKLCDISKEYGIENTFIHCFMDGRDTDPKSGKGFIEQLTAHCEKSAGKIASIVGRFYAMDRDKRWERVKEAYDLLVEGKGKQAADMVQAMQESYDEGVTDEFIKPINNSTVDGTIKEGDVVIFFNYRNDRAKELTVVLTQQDMPEQGMHTIPGLQFYCMTPYDASFKGVHILFDKENVQNTLGEYLAANGKTQLHIAETEKYAHVTFFFNGGRETPYDAEERILVPSPKVATYDLKPEIRPEILRPRQGRRTPRMGGVGQEMRCRHRIEFHDQPHAKRLRGTVLQQARGTQAPDRRGRLQAGPRDRGLETQGLVGMGSDPRDRRTARKNRQQGDLRRRKVPFRSNRGHRQPASRGHRRGDGHCTADRWRAECQRDAHDRAQAHQDRRQPRYLRTGLYARRSRHVRRGAAYFPGEPAPAPSHGFCIGKMGLANLALIM